MLTYATTAPASAALRRTKRQSDVVLVQLVRRPVDVHDQAHPRARGRGEGSARLPQVLADGQRDVDAVPVDRESYDLQRVAGNEVPVLVEDAVVGQVVLEVRRVHPTVAQHGERIAGTAAGGRLGADPRRTVGVEVADDHGDVAQPVLGQVAGQRLHGRLRRGHERLTEDEVLDRIAGQHHLREGDQVGAGLGRLAGPAAHQSRVASEVAHGRVYLGEGEAQCGHDYILPRRP